MSIIQGNAHTSAGGGYQIERSLRFNSADSAYLNRTFGAPTNNRKWTYNCWAKLSDLSNRLLLLSSGITGSPTDYAMVQFVSNGFNYQETISSATALNVSSVANFRDVAAWYMVTLVVDTTAATASNRVIFYINGVQQTLTISTQVAQNTDTTINKNTRLGGIGGLAYNGSYINFSDGYIAEANFIDGQALTPSDFGETDAATGVWKPKAYSGTYGTNGFYLSFADNTSTTTLGYDDAGSNDWTTNNFSVTAGAGNDSLVDSPTAYGTDTGVGGEVRGNYATLNPLNSSSYSTLSNGNLQSFGNTATNSGLRASTFPATTGKIVWEQTATTVSGNYPELGCISLIPNDGNGLNLAGSSTLGVQYRSNGVINKNNAASVGTFSTISSGDVVRFELDVDALTCAIYKNNSLITTVTGLTAGVFYPAVSDYNGSVTNTNFGQRPFANTANSGFKALCTTNLPTPTIGATSTTQANDYFNTVLYTGTGSSLGVTGVGFQPDWVWIKERSGAADHGLYDAVRGVQNQLESNTTTAETTEATGLTAFGTDGFTVGALAQLNTSADTYVAWNWNAGGSNATNTSGTITSTVRANTTSGFSIVTYTGTGTAATIGHGLGVAPNMVIVKVRANVGANTAWHVYHSSLANTDYLSLNTTAAKDTGSIWNNTSPTSSVFSIGSSTWPQVNNNTGTYVAYCFANVEGYSRAFSYTGNGSSDGPFVFLGFRPRFVMIKRTDSTANWEIWDTTRSVYNQTYNALYPNLSNAEDGGNAIDINSNGFKLRDTGGSTNATNSATYIGFAIAENPFKYSLAR
jgi:hypothetical protein